MSLYRNNNNYSTHAAFGCSHTWGVGVEVFEAWPCLLNARNFGVNGCSADYIARTGPALINTHNIELVYVLWPDWTRFDYTQNNQYVTSMPTDQNRIYFMDKCTNEWLIDNFTIQVDYFRNWCGENKIKLVDMTLYDLIPFLDHADLWPLSKLGHHYAPSWHVNVAEIFKMSLDKDIRHPLRHE